MQARWKQRAALAAFIAAVLGCSTPDKRLPGPPPAPMCSPGEQCGYVGRTPGSNGGGSSGGGGGSTGDPQITDVIGEVGIAVTAELDQVAPYAGVAQVKGPGPKGTIVEALYGPGTGSAFSLKGVLTGDQWLFAQEDTAGGAGVFSTFSLHSLPSPTRILVPLLDQTVIETIAQNDPSSPLLDPARAQILLALTQDGEPASGVSVTAGGARSLVVYDEGPGFYSSEAQATGSAGVILLINASIPSGGGSVTIQGTDTAGSLFQVSVPAAPGAATIGQFEM